MECRQLLVPAVAGLLIAVGARVRAEETAAARILHVNGGDFPALTMPLPADPAAGAGGAAPGCDRMRARRLDELAPGWRAHVVRIELECEQALSDDDSEPQVALDARALLAPGGVRLAGQPVGEVRLLDSERWGDHQYRIDAPYEQVQAALRAHVEQACRQARLRDEDAPAGDAECTMQALDDSLYLPTGEIGGIWVHRDPDDPGRTLYVESWAD